MRTEFDFNYPRGQIYVSKDELSIALPLLVNLVFAFEVVNLEDGNFLIEYRTKNDNDMVLLREYEASKKF